MLFGVDRPESLPSPGPRLMPLSRAGDTPGFRAAGTGLLAGGGGGPGLAFVPPAAGLACPLTTTDGVGMARGGAAGGGGGGGARACSISSTYADGVHPCACV